MFQNKSLSLPQTWINVDVAYNERLWIFADFEVT